MLQAHGASPNSSLGVHRSPSSSPGASPRHLHNPGASQQPSNRGASQQLNRGANNHSHSHGRSPLHKLGTKHRRHLLHSPGINHKPGTSRLAPDMDSPPHIRSPQQSQWPILGDNQWPSHRLLRPQDHGQPSRRLGPPMQPRQRPSLPPLAGLGTQPQAPNLPLGEFRLPRRPRSLWPGLA